jgi:hypothetical protein
MLSLATFGAELEREKARTRTRDAMVRKARAGHVMGGRKFGYRCAASAARRCRAINDPSSCEVDWMRFLVVGLAALVLVSGCAALRRTENLPSPSAEDSLGGPEGEGDPDAL